MEVVRLTSYGLVYFEHCTFLSSVKMYFHRSQFEEEPDLEKIKLFHSHNQGLEIVVDKCEFRSLINTRFNFISVIRQLYLLLIEVKLYLHIGNIKDCNSFTFINIIINNSQIHHWKLEMYGDKSIGLLKFHNTNITGFVNSEGGFGSFHFNNCIFIYNHYVIIQVESAVEVRIINCKFTPSVNHDNCRNVLGCVIYTKGFGVFPEMNTISIISLFTTSSTCISIAILVE